MVGLLVAAAAAPGACWALSALEVPGSTAWTVAAVGRLASVVRERTSYLEALVMTYGSVPEVADTALVESGPPSRTPSDCHWLQVVPEKVRIWYLALAEVAPLGHVTPTTVTVPATSWTGVTPAARAVVIGSCAPGVVTVVVASLAARSAATEDLTKPT